jgi:hypothetical protein
VKDLSMIWLGGKDGRIGRAGFLQLTAAMQGNGSLQSDHPGETGAL